MRKSFARNLIESKARRSVVCELTKAEPNRTGTHGTQCRLAPTARSHTGLSLAPLGPLLYYY